MANDSGPVARGLGPDRILLANPLRVLRNLGTQGREAGGPRFGQRLPIEPRDEAIHMDRTGRRDVLHVGLGQPPIPCRPQSEGPYPLRQGPFDACAARITLLSCCTGLPRPRRVERFVLGTRWE
jgi:hypothetical protein